MSQPPVNLPPAISVIIPSLLKPDARPGRTGQYWLSSAVSSVFRQSVVAPANPQPQPMELIIAFDAASDGRVHETETHGQVTIRYVKGARPGHAETVNTAAALATAPVMALLDDDDLWDASWLAVATAQLATADFVSSSTLLVFPDGQTAGIGDYPVPSTWVMKRSCWQTVGEFDPSLQVHCDSDFLGRLNRTPLKRAHLLDNASWADLTATSLEVGKFAELKPTGQTRPLVIRNINPDGMMARRNTNTPYAARARQDHAEILRRYTCIPA